MPTKASVTIGSYHSARTNTPPKQPEPKKDPKPDDKGGWKSVKDEKWSLDGEKSEMRLLLSKAKGFEPEDPKQLAEVIVPGLVMGALAFGHLPTIFVPAGPMTSGLPNKEKSRIRQLFEVTRFLDSSDVYQAEKDFSHLGWVTLSAVPSC